MTTDWTRLRQIMYEPSACWLATEYSGDRWLTDQFVLYNVTDMDELKDYGFHVCLGYDPYLKYEPREGECSCPAEMPDGSYQVTVASGFKPRKSVPQPDIEAYFEIMASLTWYPADPSEWSVAEHPGKAMLWGANASHLRRQGPLDCVPEPAACLLGESTWSAIKKHYPDCGVDYAFNRKAGVFRFWEEKKIFAYAAGIQIPEGQEAIAHAIAQALDSTSNGQESR